MSTNNFYIHLISPDFDEVYFAWREFPTVLTEVWKKSLRRFCELCFHSLGIEMWRRFRSFQLFTLLVPIGAIYDHQIPLSGWTGVWTLSSIHSLIQWFQIVQLNFKQFWKGFRRKHLPKTQNWLIISRFKGEMSHFCWVGCVITNFLNLGHI